ncbi:MAG: folate family ECF transporter S component [Clostridiales bacterium]|nr:folate family ECF transporter S component [Clostridiales bacterium]
MQKKSPFRVETLTFTALLIALQVVLGNILQVPLLGKQYNFGFLPIVAAGALLGAPAAMIVGGLGDFIGAHLFPQGAYFPGFTLTNVLVGLVCGLILHRCKPSVIRVIIAVGISMLINWLLNSLWLSILYTSKAYWGWVIARGPNYLVEAPVTMVLTYLTLLGLSHLKLPAYMALNGKDEIKAE